MSQIDTKALELIAAAEAAAVARIVASEEVEAAKAVLAAAEAKQAQAAAPFDAAIDAIVNHKGNVDRASVELMITTRVSLLGGVVPSTPAPAAAPVVVQEQRQPAQEPDSTQQPQQSQQAPVVEPQVPPAEAEKPRRRTPPKAAAKEVETPPAPAPDPTPVVETTPVVEPQTEPEPPVSRVASDGDNGTPSGGGDDEVIEIPEFLGGGAEDATEIWGDEEEPSESVPIAAAPVVEPTVKSAAVQSPAARSNRPAPVATPDPVVVKSEPAAAPRASAPVEQIAADDLPDFLS